MTRLVRGIIDIVKSCLTGEKVTVDADFNWNVAYEICKAHHILPMLYYGVLESELNLPDELLKRLKKDTMQLVFFDQKQLCEISQIENCFKENGIDYMLLKGAYLKHLYPKTELRIMGDADILIRTEQYDSIKHIIQQLGFDEVTESDHEYIWDKPEVLNLELHKRLIPSYNKDYYAYFGDGWKLAHKTDSTKYEMRDEDLFIYLFTHYAKHYRDAGIGIRHLVDFYVFLRAKPDLDMGYIENELKKLQLWEFCQNTLETIGVWFDGKPDSEMSDFVTRHIFKSGSYGTHENHLLSNGLKTAKAVTKEQVKKAKIQKLLFPSAKDLSAKYTVLKKAPFLLPVIWVHRLIIAVLFKRRNIKTQYKSVNMMSTENISAYQDELNYVGLDFNFEE